MCKFPRQFGSRDEIPNCWHPPQYVHTHPDELTYLDVKMLADFYRVGHHVSRDHKRQFNSWGVGWGCVHVCLAATSSISETDFFSNQTTKGAIALIYATVDNYKIPQLPSQASRPIIARATVPSPSAMPVSTWSAPCLHQTIHPQHQ